MKEIDRDICLELEKAIEENQDKSFVELLYELGVIAPEMSTDEASEITYERMKDKIKEIIPKSATDCLRRIEKICKNAVDTYDNEEFYEDDVDKFLGESMMAQTVLDVIDQYKAYLGMIEHTNEKQ